MDVVGGTLTADATTDPALSSWVPVPTGSDFPVQNLPFGVAGPGRHVVVAIGDHALDLESARLAGAIDLPARSTTGAVPLGTLGPVRALVGDLLTDDAHRRMLLPHLVRRSDLELHLPFEVPDFIDFYSSEVHATAVGRLFRPDEPLLPNWRTQPIGYHGRAGGVRVSGRAVERPWGQVEVDGEVRFQPSAALDFELEVAAVIGRPTEGPVDPDRALDHVAGLVLLNDWSARDIQRWEYRPLGPFLGKAFASTISPWVVTTEALGRFVTTPPVQDPPPLPHLRPAGPTWDIDVSVAVDSETVGAASYADLYWTVPQQVAHLTHGGARLRTGDLLGSGTISSDRPGGSGSLLEATGGTRYLADGDVVTLRGVCDDGQVRIGFGDCTALVRPATALEGARS